MVLYLEYNDKLRLLHLDNDKEFVLVPCKRIKVVALFLWLDNDNVWCLYLDNDKELILVLEFDKEWFLYLDNEKR